MKPPHAIRPQDLDPYNSAKMGKYTIFKSPRLLVGLNAFEAGQEHVLHTHAGMDKVYHVLEGEGHFLLADREIAVNAGSLMVIPEGAPHGIRNDSSGRLLVLAILAPSP